MDESLLRTLSRFVGRTRELRQLADLMGRVRATGEGMIVTIRGRRQVGKSTLVEEFLRTEDIPHAFFAASFGADPAGQRASFTAEVAASTLPSAVVMQDVAFSTWDGLLAALAEGIRGPSVVVVDELPWLLRADPSFTQEWAADRSVTGFVRRQLNDSTSPLVVVSERGLNAEFPAGLLARDVLLAVGGGATAFPYPGSDRSQRGVTGQDPAGTHRRQTRPPGTAPVVRTAKPSRAVPGLRCLPVLLAPVHRTRDGAGAAGPRRGDSGRYCGAVRLVLEQDR